MRPSPISSMRASARPAYAGCRSKSPTRPATRLAPTAARGSVDCVMQATVPQVAIEEKANRDDRGRVTTFVRPPDPTLSAVAPRRLTELGPVASLRAGRLARRLPQLFVGLVLYGVSLAMMVRGDLGLAPWDVLHSGLI